jgi:hypothetical protein
LSHWPSSGGKNASNVPTDKGYTKIYSNQYAFAALKADGSIKALSVGAFVYAFSKSLHEFLKSPHAVIDPLALRAAKALVTTWGNPDFGGTYASGHNLALGVLLIGVGTEVCFIRNTNLVVA